MIGISYILCVTKTCGCLPISGCQMVPDIIWLPTDVMRTKQTNKLITLHLLGISDLVVTIKEGFRQLRIKSCIA